VRTMWKRERGPVYTWERDGIRIEIRRVRGPIPCVYRWAIMECATTRAPEWLVRGRKAAWVNRTWCFSDHRDLARLKRSTRYHASRYLAGY
jgi:hypothetical protein